MPPQVTIPAARIAELIAKARAKAAVSRNTSLEAQLSNIQEVDLSNVLPQEATMEQRIEATSELFSAANFSAANFSGQNSGGSSNTNILSRSVSPNGAGDILDSNKTTASSAAHAIGVTRSIILNEKQTLAATTALSGESFVLIGAAGTGKTTSMRSITRQLIDSGKLGTLSTGTKKLSSGSPGAAVISYTRKAVANIRHAVVDELKPNTLTVHMLLEFAPEFFEIEDPERPGIFKKSMRFIPTRNALNPLPAALCLLAIEESSMLSVELYSLLQDAMPHKHQEIFLGDINQLPPIFGQAILGFKMLELPVVQLTEVYRQARESPILDLAWKLLEGEQSVFSPTTTKYKVPHPTTGKPVDRVRVPALEALSRKATMEDGSTSEVVFQPWQKPLSVDHAFMIMSAQLRNWITSGYYNPEEDIILCPFNKSFGTIEINKAISDYLGKQREATITEVISGFQKHYLAVGDRVLFDKEDAFITSIRRNPKYLGKSPQPASTHLDRWGHLDTSTMDTAARRQLAASTTEDADFELEALDNFLNSGSDDSAGERVQAASHVVEVRYAYMDELDTPIVLETAAEINALLGGYCITVHKFQGSEAERVFLFLHHSHATMILRELLYTAVTRARSFLHVVCEVDTFYKGVKAQKIKGNTLEEKAEWFKGKKEQQREQGKLLS